MSSVSEVDLRTEQDPSVADDAAISVPNEAYERPSKRKKGSFSANVWLQKLNAKLSVIEEEHGFQYLVILIGSDSMVYTAGSSSCDVLRAACVRNAVDFSTRSLLHPAPGASPNTVPMLQYPEFLTLKNERHKYRNAIRKGVVYLCKPTTKKESRGYGSGLPKELEEYWPDDVPFVEPGNLRLDTQKLVWERMESTIRAKVEDRHHKAMLSYYGLERVGRSQRDSGGADSVPLHPPVTPVTPIQHVELRNWYCVRKGSYAVVRGILGRRVADFGPLTGFDEEVDTETSLVCTTKFSRVVLRGPCNELEFAYAGFGKKTVAAFKSRDIVRDPELYLYPLKLYTSDEE